MSAIDLTMSASVMFFSFTSSAKITKLGWVRRATSRVEWEGLAPIRRMK